MSDFIRQSHTGYNGRGRTPAGGPGWQGNEGAWPYPIYPEPGQDRHSPAFLARLAQLEEKESESRQLDDQAGRVETGVVRFGDDWPGYFIRGDDALALVAEFEQGNVGALYEFVERLREVKNP